MSLMHVDFKDGPARGQFLRLKRAPVFLRVVQGLNGFDALDLPTDTPRAGELIYAYMRTGPDGWCHLDGRDPKTGKRWSETNATGSYALCREQPPDATMRDAAKWQAWCASQPLAEWAKNARMP